MELVYFPHATSVDNERRIATGWLPGALSDAGREQAATRRFLADEVDAVFTSDLTRAVETVDIAFGGSGLPVFHDARLRECNYGDLNGAPVAEIDAIRATRIHEPFPGGESYVDAVARLRSCLDDMARDWAGKRVAVIAHGAQRWGLEHLVNGTPLEDLVGKRDEWREEGWRYTYG